MRKYILSLALIFGCISLQAQQIPGSQPAADNIYTLKKQFLEKVLHNNTDENKRNDDNDLERFNRWFNFVAPRCYPSGNLPSPDILLKESQLAHSASRMAARTTGSAPAWQPLGPTDVPTGFFGIGRVNCIVIDPVDTNTLYIGAACGGVWISHNGGATWVSNSDNFPSLSVADIVVNPNHTDTIYAATGDGYGYEAPDDTSIFWGGLYSAGVMKSADGGSTWQTTGLSYLQSNRDIIQKLLIYPKNPNVLLAATRNGIYRTADAGMTWARVDTGHVYSMAFRPMQTDTVYAVDNSDLRISYDAGLTWHTVYAGINTMNDRCTIGVSQAAPANVWVLDAMNNINVSYDGGNTFLMLSAPPTYFYGYYDRVLGISPANANLMMANGMNMSQSTDGGNTWNSLDTMGYVHPDNHAVTFNPLNPSTFYVGDDGGIFVTHDQGNTWANLSNGLMISQVYRLSSSRQNPAVMLCGLQDNGCFYNNGANWMFSNIGLGDGMDVAIYPKNDSVQVGSFQYGNFGISLDQGNTWNSISGVMGGYWTAPVVFDRNNPDTLFFGGSDVYASYDEGFSVVNLTNTMPFNDSSMPGCVSLAVAPSNINVIYAADFKHMLRSSDGGVTWTDITGNLPSATAGITHIAIDYFNPMLVYATLSGYLPGTKVFKSATGGSTWTNISNNLPNLPADCIVVDSAIRGALYVGTDIGVYYTDAYQSNWTLYGSGLPNVIVDGMDINYTDRKLKVSTYGRGIWEVALKPKPLSTPSVTIANQDVQLYPNPTTHSWQLVFTNQKPGSYTLKVTDITGKTLHTQVNKDLIDATGFASGVYNIEVNVGDNHFTLQAVKD